MIGHIPPKKILSSFLLMALLTSCSLQAGNLSETAPSMFNLLPSAQTIAFVPNPGLGDSTLLFRALGTVPLFFAQNELILTLTNRVQSSAQFNRLQENHSIEACDPTQPATVRLQFIAADAEVRVVGRERLIGIVNYYIGNDPAQWKTNVPTYGSLAYEGLYPGIDLVYQGGEGALKGTFMVAPGANPERIRWRYQGASGVKLNKGDLLVGADEEGKEPLFIERKPLAWQILDGKRKEVRVRYVIHEDGSIGFALGKYDPSQPLVIDPTLDYGTYWGDAGCEGAYYIALDSSNNVYITGPSNSPGFPPANPNCEETAYFDVYVTKLDPSKNDVNQHIYTTYLGGSEYEITIGVGVDSVGNAYAAGFTASSDLPTTANAYQKTFGDSLDGMVLQLNASGAIQYLSYLGGTKMEEVAHMALGNGSLIYAIGFTGSEDFPVTENAYKSTIQENDYDAFVSVIDTSKSGEESLIYSTYYGGSAGDEGYAIAVDNNLIYFAGTTNSTDLPLKNPVQDTLNGGMGWGDVYAAVIDPSQSGVNQLRFATYLGGSDTEVPGGVAPAGSEYMYVTGITKSSDFPTTGVSPSFGGEQDAFLTKLDIVAPTSLVYSRFVGGSKGDGFRGLAVDDQDNVYVAGASESNNFPTVDPIEETFQGGAPADTDGWAIRIFDESDVVVAKFNPSGTMTFGSYLGGNGAESASSIALGEDGKVYVAGGTRSTNLDTENAYQTTNAGNYDAFVIALGGLIPAQPTPTLTPVPTEPPVTTPVTPLPTQPPVTPLPTQPTVTPLPTQTQPTPSAQIYLPAVVRQYP